MANLQYIGARYVPIVYTNPDDGTSNWKSGVAYESLTIVTVNGDSYTSKKAVPDGIGAPQDNPTYWVKTGDFNASLVSLQNRVLDLENQNGDETLLTVAQTLSGAVNELSKLKVIVTPEMYGAVGDGVNDDTNAINSALNNAENKIVVFSGNYLIDGAYTGDFHTTGLQIKSNTKIVFTSNSSIIMKTAATETASIFTIIDVENVEISGGTIIGDYDSHTIIGTTDEWCHGFTIYGAKNIHIHDMTIKDCFGDGVYVGQFPSYGGERPAVNHCKNVTLNNLIIDKAGRNGIAIGDCDKWIISNCVITNVNRTLPKSAIDIEQEGDYTPFVSDGIIEHLKTAGCSTSVAVVTLVDSIVSINDVVGDPIDTANNTVSDNRFQIVISNSICPIKIWMSRVKIINCVITQLVAPRETGLESEAFEMYDCYIKTPDSNSLSIKNNFKAVNCHFQNALVLSGRLIDLENCIFDNSYNKNRFITLSGSLNEVARIDSCIFKNVLSTALNAIWNAITSSGQTQKCYVLNCSCETSISGIVSNQFVYAANFDTVVNGNCYAPYNSAANSDRLVAGCVNFNT